MESHNVVSGEVVTSVINLWAVLVAAIVTMLGLGAISGGLLALRRASDGIARTIAWAAAIAGAFLLLALGLAIGLDAPPPVFAPVFAAVLGLFGMVFWVLTLVDCATREPDHGNNKVVWVLIILFAHVIGAALYWLARRPARLAEVGR